MTADQPIIVFAGDLPKATLSRMSDRDYLVRLGRGVYTTDLSSDPRIVAKRHWGEIIGHLYPGAILNGRSALKRMPDTDGAIYIGIDHTPRSTPSIAGIRIIPKKDNPPAPSDRLTPWGLYVPSLGRAIASNVSPSHKTASHPRRNLTVSELTDWVAIATQGNSTAHTETLKASIADLDRSGYIRPSDAERAIQYIDAMHYDIPTVARYDGDTIRRIATLARYLEDNPTTPRPSQSISTAKTILEAMHTNIIEGNVHTLAATKDIIATGTTNNPGESAVYNSWAVATQLPPDLSWVQDPAGFVNTVAIYHRTLAENIPAMAPGHFKRYNNQAGGTVFVPPELVVGTLSKGISLINQMQRPEDQAIALHALLTSVHPFADGNGRLSRLMMNELLEQNGAQRIIITKDTKAQYIDALRRLSDIPGPYVEFMRTAQQTSVDQVMSSASTALPLWTEGLAPALPVRCGKLVLRTQKPCLLFRGHSGMCRSVITHEKYHHVV